MSGNDTPADPPFQVAMLNSSYVRQDHIRIPLITKEKFTNKLDMFSISKFVKNVGSELNIRGSHRRMSLPEVQDIGNLMNGFQGYDQSHEDFMSTCVRCRKSRDAATPRSRR